MITISAIYEGKVQGVGFRSAILSLAKGYEVTGWVKNLLDGRVEVLCSGNAGEIEGFLAAVRESHLAGHIDHENVAPAAREEGMRGFRIID